MPAKAKSFIFIISILIFFSCSTSEEKKKEKKEITLKEFCENIPLHTLPYKDTINWSLDSTKLIPPNIVQQLRLKEILKAKTTYHMDGSKFYILHKLNLSPDLNCLVICWKWSNEQMFNYLMVFDNNFNPISSYCLSQDEIAESAFYSYSFVEKTEIETHEFNFFDKTETTIKIQVTENGVIKELSRKIDIPEIYNCDYYNPCISLGIGILIPAKIFQLYNDSILKDLYMSWDFGISDNPPKPVCSLYYKPDYGIAHYVCVDSSNDYYKILINSNEVKYCPKNSSDHFENWEKYIFHSKGGIDLIDKKQALKKEPADNSETILQGEDHGTICGIEVKGDWLKVICFCYPKDKEVSRTAWIKWREGNKLLIEIHQLI